MNHLFKFTLIILLFIGSSYCWWRFPKFNKKECGINQYKSSFFGNCKTCSTKLCLRQESCCKSSVCTSNDFQWNGNQCLCKKGFYLEEKKSIWHRVTLSKGTGTCHSAEDLVKQIPESKKQECIDGFTRKLGLKMNETIQSDPKLFREILETDMQFKHIPEMLHHFDDLNEPVDLRPMIRQIQVGIKDRQPAFQEFLCEIHDNFDDEPIEKHFGVFTSKNEPAGERNLHEVINLILHHTYILDRVTVLTVQNATLMDNVIAGYMRIRKEYNVSSALEIFKKTDAFEIAKTKTLDSGFRHIQKIRSGNITQADVDKRISALNLNILEAVSSDYFAGRGENAKAGLALILNPMVNLTKAKDYDALEYHFVDQWPQIYHSWNMAFVSERSHNNYLWSKLLAPSVMGATPENYIFYRVVALYHTVNSVLFQKALEQNYIQMEMSEEVSKIWGKINLNHAEKMNIDNRGTKIKLSRYVQDKLEQIGRSIKKKLQGIVKSFRRVFYTSKKVNSDMKKVLNEIEKSK